MEEKYHVKYIINGMEKETDLLIREEENYVIEMKLNDENIIAEADNCFYALVELRKELEKRGIALLCKGCCRNVYPSPMILSMGDAIKAYRIEFGRQARNQDLVNIFDSCEYEEYASVEEQCRYYIAWVNSIGK